MREFKKYAPRQIAKYVCDFFKGTFAIKDVGIFSFEGGKVVISNEKDTRRLSICKEINKTIHGMTGHLRAS